MTKYEDNFMMLILFDVCKKLAVSEKVFLNNAVTDKIQYILVNNEFF